MEKRQSAPGTSPPAEQPPRRRRPLRRTLLAAAVAGAAGAAAFGGLLVLLPKPTGDQAPRPASGPQAQARARAQAQARTLTAVTAGLPAALPEVTALIGERERYVRAHPRDARAWAVLGRAYVLRAGRTADTADYPRAERALKTSLERTAKNADALDGLAALAVARRDFTAARDWGEQALRLDAKRWTTQSLLIDAYTGLGDSKAAGKAFDKLMALRTPAGTRPALMARASAVYRDRGWREDAAAQITDAAATASTPAEQAAYLERTGRLSFERGDREDALRHFEAALRLDPALPDALAGRARTLAALGRTDDALAAWTRALAARPSPRHHLEAGELYESLGRDGQAREQYRLLRQRAERDAADGADDELLLGRFEADHGDPQEAVERLRAEWERQPGVEVADALGWALYRAGEPDEALVYARKATDSSHGGVVRSALHTFHLGVVERELGQDAVARRHLKEALLINPYFSPLLAPEAQAAVKDLGEVPDAPAPVW